MADSATLAILLKLQGGGDLQRGLQAASQGFKNFEEKIRPVTLAMAAASGAILAFAGLSVRSFARTGEELKNMATKTGFSVESLSELKFAIEGTGGSLQMLPVAFRTLSQVVTDAGMGTKQYVDILARLGISAAELKALKPEEAFFKAAEAVAGQTDAMTRAALAQDVFGRGGLELLPILEKGKAGLAAMRQEARKLGVVFTEEMVRKAELVDDSMDRLKGAFQGVQLALASELVPQLVYLVSQFTEVIKVFGAFVKDHPGIVKAAVTVAAALMGIVIALKAMAAARAMVQALSGPTGLASLGIGLAAGGAAIYAMNRIPAINVNVQGNVLTPDGLAESITPAVRRRLAQIENNNSLAYSHRRP